MRKLPEFDQIIGFLTVAEELNFRRASERLAIDQSALSRRIKSLEDRLGFPLMFRTTHSVRLTDAGRAFYDANRHTIEYIDSSIEQAHKIARGATGSLRIAYMAFAAIDLVPLAVKRYTRAFPDVSLVLSYQNTISQKLSLARGEIDIGLMLGPLEHRDFDTLSVAEEQLVAVMSEASRLASMPELCVEDIADEPLILGTREQWDFYRNIIAEILALKGYRAKILYEAPSLFGILGLVRAGLGITLVPEAMERFCPKGMTTRHIRDAGIPISTVAAWRRPPEGNVAEFTKILRKIAAANRAAAKSKGDYPLVART
jgi:DNA-binding transcriptional LysR family regulator